MSGLEFTKAVATGNDFVIIDNFKSGGWKGKPFSALAREVCDRKRSIGADGMLIVERSKRADFRMRIFNPDGTEAAMCGNGSRCVALYAKSEGVVRKPSFTIETGAGRLEASVKGDVAKIRMTDPKNIRWNLCLLIHDCPYEVSLADTGVPHVIHFTKDIENVDVKKLGESLRYHKEFSPAGANADFVQVIGRHKIKVRTYERGVEDETLACGTGAVASAIIAAESEKLPSPISVMTRSGEELKVYFELTDGAFKNVFLEGRARLVFKGKAVIQN